MDTNTLKEESMQFFNHIISNKWKTTEKFILNKNVINDMKFSK